VRSAFQIPIATSRRPRHDPVQREGRQAPAALTGFVEESMPSAPRCVALVGPYLSGKTSLLEAMLFASGTVGRHGSVREGNSVGDHAAEARARQM